jgi:RNA polymerase sigma-70 factor, ECF subfamily
LNLNQQTEFIHQLVDNHGKHIFAVAYRVIGDASQAEDIAQTVFVKLLQLTNKQLQTIEHWRGYLSTLATRAAIDLMRKHCRDTTSTHHQQSISFDESKLQQPNTVNHSPSAGLDIDRDMTQIRLALTKLSQQESEVIVLRLIEEFSYQEISQQLKISNSLVGVTLHRAHKKLLTLLQESNFLGEIYEQA